MSQVSSAVTAANFPSALGAPLAWQFRSWCAAPGTSRSRKTILIIPSLLNYIVAIYLIVVGLIGLNDIYHFIK